jgi:plasmid stabilization system protein ParE
VRQRWQTLMKSTIMVPQTSEVRAPISIHAALARLLTAFGIFPVPAQSAQNLEKASGCILSRQHHIYYILKDQQVQILRVIHHARDVQDLDLQ